MNKVAIGMSGGVDSSVSIHLLQAQGYDVVGIHLLLAEDSEKTQQGLRDAEAVAAAFQIPFYVFDERAYFEQHVVKPFTTAYTLGLTPNPCVHCNATIKFGRLWTLAQALDCTHLATGHYVRLAQNKFGTPCLKKAQDLSKDQSYFLYAIPADILPHLIFPLGSLEKVSVRRIASDLRLPIAEKSDSQEICFIPNDDYIAYLETQQAHLPLPGDFIDEKGHIIGQHAGIHRYTIGQRKGLGLALGYPAYVTAIRANDNSIVVGKDHALWRDHLYAGDCHFHQQVMPGSQGRAVAKIRSRDAGQPATWSFDGEKLSVHFDEPVRAITQGQSVVLYVGDCILGGGTILT